MELTVTIDGDRQVLTTLGLMTESILERLRRTLPELGQQVKDAAAGFAPRKTGKLRGGLTSVLHEGAGDRIWQTVGVGKAFYGRFQETGLNTMRKPPRRRGIVGARVRISKTGTALVTSRRGLMRRAAGWSEKPFRLPAHPFLHPAVSSMRDRIVAGLNKAIADGLK